MEIKKVYSYFVAMVLGVLCVAPPLDYRIPMGGPLLIDQWKWVYMVILAGLFGFFLLSQGIHWTLKVLVVYLFISSFASQLPAESFNAFVVIVATLYFFILCQKCDFNIIINMLVAVFWFQIVLATLQHFGYDRLLLFGSGFSLDKEQLRAIIDSTDIHKGVYWGTVFQQMRLSSLFCILSPFLLLKSKWYMIPIAIWAFLFGSLGFTFALGIGLVIYLMMTIKDPGDRVALFWIIGIFCLICAVRSSSHIRVEIVEGRLPIWWLVIKSWCLDTTGKVLGAAKDGTWIWDAYYHNGKPDLFGISQTGPWDWTRFWVGHGLDSYVSIFMIYKHDKNAFNPAHNSHLQYLWEIGLIGFTLIEAYLLSVFVRLYNRKEWLLFAGCFAVWINMFFHFPDRMTQTIWLLVAYGALCEQRINSW